MAYRHSASSATAASLIRCSATHWRRGIIAIIGAGQVPCGTSEHQHARRIIVTGSIRHAPFRQPPDVGLQAGQEFGVLAGCDEVGFSSPFNSFKASFNCRAVSGLRAGCMRLAGGGRRGTDGSGRTSGLQQPASKIPGSSISSSELADGFTFDLLVDSHLAGDGIL